MSLPTATVARHSMDSPDWYTPAPIVFAAREVMGGIDLDPASCEDANRVADAAHYYTAEDDGRRQPWFGMVFLNPPGGKDDAGRSLVADFWCRLMRAWETGEIEAAIWVGYSMEQLQTLQNADTIATPLDFSMCIPRKRIAFVENAAKRAARIAKLTAAGKTPNLGSQPSHANYITYLGHDPSRFARIFDQFGQVVIR